MACPNYSSSNMPWTWTQPSTSTDHGQWTQPWTQPSTSTDHVQWTQPSTSKDHVQWTWSQLSTPVNNVASTWSQPSITVEHTAKADTAVNYMAQNNEFWNFLGSPIPSQTLIDPPVKKTKLDIGSESLCLDDLLTPFTPTMANNSTYLDILSQLEKDLALPNPAMSSVKQVQHTPIKENSKVSVQRDLLSYAIDFIGINENDVNDIPHTASPSRDLLSIAIDSIGENDVDAIPETGTCKDLLTLAVDSIGIDENGVNSLRKTESISTPTAPRKSSLTHSSSSMNHAIHSPIRKRPRSPTRKKTQYPAVKKPKQYPDVQNLKQYSSVKKPTQWPTTNKLLQKHPSLQKVQQYSAVQKTKKYPAVKKSKQNPTTQKLQSVQKVQQHPAVHKQKQYPAEQKVQQLTSLPNVQQHPAV